MKWLRGGGFEVFEYNNVFKGNCCGDYIGYEEMLGNYENKLIMGEEISQIDLTKIDAIRMFALRESDEFLWKESNVLLKNYFTNKLSIYSGCELPKDKRKDYAFLVNMVNNMEEEKSLSELESESHKFAKDITKFSDIIKPLLGIR